MMQDIVVTVLRGGKEVDLGRFCNPPKQASQIIQALEAAGYKGDLQDARYTYTTVDLLLHGAYTLKVLEAATGKSISRPSCLGLPLPERLSPGSICLCWQLL